jgi:hypothetical protein
LKITGKNLVYKVSWRIFFENILGEIPGIGVAEECNHLGYT